MNRPKNRKKIVAAVFVLLSLLGLWLMFSYFSTPKTTYDPKASREVERGGPEIIILNNSEKLSKFLLPAQFDITKGALNDFIKNNISQAAKSATIISEPQQNERGVITFAVRVDDAGASTFTVTVDKWTHYDKLIFSVPEKSYSVTLPVYTN